MIKACWKGVFPAVQTSSAPQPLAPDSPCREERWSFPFSPPHWAATPEPVRQHLTRLQEDNERLRAQLDELLARLRSLDTAVDKAQSQLRQDSRNSNRPPSSDNPYRKNPAPPNPGKAGAKKGHPGHSQPLLPPSHPLPVTPQRCACGNTRFTDLALYHTHQEIELPELPLEVRHFLLHEATCTRCGTRTKART